MRAGSIRWRITALATVLALAVLTLAALVVVVAMRSELIENLDRSLEQRADQIAAAARADPVTAVANTDDEDRFAQVLDDDGGVLFATGNVAGARALADPPPGRQASRTRSDLPLEDDAYRVLVRRFDVDGSARFVVVGENIDDVRDSVRALVVTLGLVIPAAVAVLAGVVWWLVGRTLRPVEAIRSEVAAIGLDQLDRRVPTPGSDDEIDRLAGTMNEMLARLQASSDAQRRFVADVSHELRTPLTRMRTALEVDLARPGSDLDATCRDVLDDAIGMQALAEDLLFLARSDAGTIRARSAPIDLDVIVAAEVADQRAAAPDVEIDIGAVSAAVVVGDEAQLARMVRNLLANAARHAVARVEVTLAESTDGAHLVVSDDGAGVPAADRDRIFDPFVRLDEARADRDGGTGLGLAIVRDIARRHRAEISVGESTSGGASFSVRIPRRPDGG